MLESANWSKVSVTKHLKPLFQHYVGPGKGQNGPIAGRCTKA